MNALLILGILAIIAGIAILIYPMLLVVIVATALIVLGAYLVYISVSTPSRTFP